MGRGSVTPVGAMSTDGSPVGSPLFHQSLAADRKLSPFRKHSGPMITEDPTSGGFQLLDAALKCDPERLEKVLADAGLEDLHYLGTRQLKVRSWEIVLNAERPVTVSYGYNEYRTDVTPLFGAAQTGNAEMVEKLLVAGADANARVFRGYPSTVAAQEGHAAALQALLRGGRLRVDAIDDAVLEAALHNQRETLQLLLDTRFAQPPALQQALVQASFRGHVEIVRLLIEAGVDVNCSRRILVQCAQPPLHLNATCTPLIAAVVSWQKNVVDVLLQAGASTKTRASIGAWTWDQTGGEEFKVGAGLGESYPAAWAAVEYCRGPLGAQILEALLRQTDVSEEVAGRTLLFHAVLCKNAAAVSTLLKPDSTAHPQVQTPSSKQTFRPIHLAARLGDPSVITPFLTGGSDIDSRDEAGRTAAMIAADLGHVAVLTALITAGADLGLTDGSGKSLLIIADESGNGGGNGPLVRKLVLQSLVSGRVRSSNPRVFHPLLFAAAEGDVYVIRRLLKLDADDVTVPPGKLVKKRGSTRGSHVADSSPHRSNSPTSTLQPTDSPSPPKQNFVPLPPAPTTENCPPLDIDAQDCDGNTAMILCTRRAHLGALEVLLRSGGSLGISNSAGDTVLTSAASAGLREDVADVILEALRDGQVARSPGFFPLHFASRWKDERAMAAVLKADVDADVDELDDEGMTAVMVCAQQGFVEGCRVLLEAGAQAEKRGARGLTALQLARERGPKVSAAVEKALFDHVARRLVLTGAPLMKHTREGRGKPHEKVPCMKNGVFWWGEKGARRLKDVAAELGGGVTLRKNRPKESDGALGKTFSVEARMGRTVYFEAGSKDEAELWVHGINLLAQEAALNGKTNGS